MIDISELQMTDEQKEKYKKLLNDNKLIDQEIGKLIDDVKAKLNSKEKINEDVWGILVLLAIFYNGDV